MKRLLFCCLLLSSLFTAKAQTRSHLKTDTIDITHPVDSSKQVYTLVESDPSFPGGIQEFYKYLSKNINIPFTEYVKGKVFVSFVIGADGHVIEPTIIKGIVTDSMKKEILRVLTESPAWTPGIQNSKPVRIQYTMPINF